ncbi:MAG: phosphoribosyltransferase family protein [Anaerolineae bacterium]
MTARNPMRHSVLSWADVDRLIDQMVPQIRGAGAFDALLIITRGGIVPGGLLCEALDIPYTLIAAVRFQSDLDQQAQLAAMPTFLQFPEDSLLSARRTLIVDDVWGSGRTSTAVKNRCLAAGATAFSCVMHFNPYRSLFTRAEPDFYGAVTDAHVTYPWEVDRGIRGIPIGFPESN